MKHSSIPIKIPISNSEKKEGAASTPSAREEQLSANPLISLVHRLTLASGALSWAFLLITTVLFSCSTEPSQTVENKIIERDTIQTDFIFSESKDSVIKNGEYIKHYKNGVIEMRGIMKDGKRDGLWKSWYEDGSPWSETTFKDGKKNGKTTTWYGNDKKRYEGFYANDIESGKWTFWAENGNIQSTQNY